MPSAISKPREPVEMASISRAAGASPMRITVPLPNWRSIWPKAAARAFFLFSSIDGLHNLNFATGFIIPYL